MVMIWADSLGMKKSKRLTRSICWVLFVKRDWTVVSVAEFMPIIPLNFKY